MGAAGGHVGESEPKTYRAGQAIVDLCRACKVMRDHTVMVVDGAGRALRVVCGFCGSQHNYRGGEERDERASGAYPSGAAPTAHVPAAPALRASPPLVRDDELSGETVETTDDVAGLERLLRRILREELGLTPVAIAERWRGGELVLRPGKTGLQEKKWPIDALFHKIVMIRNRLRSLEQQVNAAELPEDLKLRLQAYVSGCYGTLTSFNVLFAVEDDKFHGAGGAD
jgi:hypothetical protein